MYTSTIISLTYANRRGTPLYTQLLIQLASLSPSISRTIDVVAILTKHVTWGIEILSTWSDHKCIVYPHQLHTPLRRTGSWITRPRVIRLTGSYDRTCEIVSRLACVVTGLVCDLRTSALDSPIERIKQHRTRISCGNGWYQYQTTAWIVLRILGKPI